MNTGTIHGRFTRRTVPSRDVADAMKPGLPGAGAVTRARQAIRSAPRVIGSRKILTSINPPLPAKTNQTPPRVAAQSPHHSGLRNERSSPSVATSLNGMVASIANDAAARLNKPAFGL